MLWKVLMRLQQAAIRFPVTIESVVSVSSLQSIFMILIYYYDLFICDSGIFDFAIILIKMQINHHCRNQYCQMKWPI